MKALIKKFRAETERFMINNVFYICKFFSKGGFSK